MSKCSFFANTNSTKLSDKEKFCLYHKINYLVFMLDVREFYTWGNTEFDLFCISVLEQLKDTQEIKIFKILKDNDTFDADENPEYDDMIRVDSDDIASCSIQIADKSDFVMLDSIDDESYTFDVYLSTIMKAKKGKDVHLWILEEKL